MTMPCFSAAEASTSQIRVSAALRWQKKSLRYRSGLLQWLSNRRVMGVTPG